MATRLVPPDGGWPVLRAAAELGAPVTDEAVKALSVWLDLLVAWNARVDLTAARSPDELVDLMLADALVLSTRIPGGLAWSTSGRGQGRRGWRWPYSGPIST